MLEFDHGEYKEFINSIPEDVVERESRRLILGTIGHVANGKSTVVRTLSGTDPIRHKKEKERNITIYIGYAAFKIHKSVMESLNLEKYEYNDVSTEDYYIDMIKSEMYLEREIMLEDNPGHNILINTMLKGVRTADAVLLIISANESCPQPQTLEHLIAIDCLGINNIIILQNKIDLVSMERAMESHREITEFVKGTIAENAPIIPVCAQLGYNFDILTKYIVEKIPLPLRNLDKPPLMCAMRSFDINKPNTDVLKIKGGVIGGSIINGVFRIGQDIEIRPGLVYRNDNIISYKPLFTRITSLHADKNKIDYAFCGNLVGIGTTLDPSLTKANKLDGQLIGAIGTLPEVYITLEVEFTLLRKDLESGKKMQTIKKDEILCLNVNVTSVRGQIIQVHKTRPLFKVALLQPVCCDIGEKVIILRKYGKSNRIIGYGTITCGK